MLDSRRRFVDFIPLSVCGGVKPLTHYCLGTVFRLLLAYSHHNEQRKKLHEPSFNWESPSRQVTTAFDHHQSWVRRRLQGSHCSDLPGGKQGCQFDSSLAFSKLIRYWVYIGTPIGASVFFLYSELRVLNDRTSNSYFYFCAVWFACKKSCIYPG